MNFGVDEDGDGRRWGKTELREHDEEAEEVRVEVRTACCKVFGRDVHVRGPRQESSRRDGKLRRSSWRRRGSREHRTQLGEGGIRGGYFGIEKREGIRGERRDNLRESVSPGPGRGSRPRMGV